MPFWTGTPVDDYEMLQRVPQALAESLQRRNGYIAALGGFHLRGASSSPAWHSLRTAWEGPNALHRLFPALCSTDVPFAQDCFGDQFLLREGRVIHLQGETGTVQQMDMNWQEYMRRVDVDPFGFLNLEPLRRYREQGGALEPGQLLSVYPPFNAVGGGASFRPIDTMERIAALADFALQISEVQNGEQVTIVPR